MKANDFNKLDQCIINMELFLLANGTNKTKYLENSKIKKEYDDKLYFSNSNILLMNQYSHFLYY
jgi:hypothetical protein